MNFPRLDQETMQTIVERCAPLVAGADETEPRLPVRVLCDEAIVAAEVVDDHFEEKVIDGKPQLGLRSLSDTGRFPSDMSSQLREFSTAVAKVQSDYLTLLQKLDRTPIERAEFIISETRAALSYLLEDGDHPTGEAQLDALRDEYEAGSSQSILAASLEGFAALGMKHQADLIALADFDESLLDEAAQVAHELRQRLADQISGDSENERTQLLSLRNRLITGLSDRHKDTRRAIRYLFREHPKIVRTVGSEYERDRRRRARRAQEAPASGVNASDETLVPAGSVAG